MAEVGRWQWRLEMRLTALQVTHAAAADAAGMSRSTFSAFVRADSANTSTVEKVETALGLPSGWLIKDASQDQLAFEAASFEIPEWLRAEDARKDAEEANGKV